MQLLRAQNEPNIAMDEETAPLSWLMRVCHCIIVHPTGEGQGHLSGLLLSVKGGAGTLVPTPSTRVSSTLLLRQGEKQLSQLL